MTPSTKRKAVIALMILVWLAAVILHAWSCIPNIEKDEYGFPAYTLPLIYFMVLIFPAYLITLVLALLGAKAIDEAFNNQ